jgi:membrane fusion protein
VAAGQVLAQLLPASSMAGAATKAAAGAAPSPLVAYFYVPTRAAGFVEPGQTVKLRYAAYPYQKFGMGEGTVTQVERTPYALQELPAQIAASVINGSAASTNTPEPVYRVTVALYSQSIDAYGEAHPLKPGMVAEADIVQRSYRLYEQILEPLRGFAQRGG